MIAEFAKLSTLNRTQSEVNYRAISRLHEVTKVRDNLLLKQISAIYKKLQLVKNLNFTVYKVAEKDYQQLEPTVQMRIAPRKIY